MNIDDIAYVLERRTWHCTSSAQAQALILEQLRCARAAAYAQVEQALAATTWQTAAMVAWLGPCDHDVGVCYCDIISAMDAGVAALTVIREEEQ